MPADGPVWGGHAVHIASGCHRCGDETQRRESSLIGAALKLVCLKLLAACPF